MNNVLARPLELPCGATLKNRIAKAAMSEGMANTANHATLRLDTLYERWARSGAGLLLSGNIQVDRLHLERPLNIVIDDDSGRRQLARLASAGKAHGAHFWAQLSHPGRQVDIAINAAPLAPSAVALDVLRGLGEFAMPRAMTEAQIERAIGQFAFAALEARDAGFTGVSLHAAHGYLISQFLSKLSNTRDDRWGGSLANRARFLLSVLEAVRRAVGPRFPVAIKLNSSDFQRGGFNHEECIELVKMLNGSTLDLLELSGGSLEQPKVMGISLKDEGEDGPPQSTVQREAYFLNFAKDVRDVARMPVMVVGGFRSASVMAAAIEHGELDVVGLGRPMAADPDLPARLLSGAVTVAPRTEDALEIFHVLPWHIMQLERMADGLEPDLALGGPQAADMFGALEARNASALLRHRQLAADRQHPIGDSATTP
ncbi:NADH:flavin oxidoreductase/NADH oxidase family protein [Variovorax paradoxus]|uniref:NADH:flavin oxidoreductase/NADH oxidase family protein n=1 Tax=Variovorax paradoxus TaxID=34073 RepID=UPI0005AC5A97|nr:NADH:flavin oxidoreductase/NADH oxidase family protein [Variovorax paradoxus]